MLNPADLRSYQLRMVEHVCEHPFSALWVDMGLGKTVAALTATKQLIDDFEIDKTLVIAPLRVARKVWTDEIQHWAHLRGLTTSKILGSRDDRLTGMSRDADIYLINRENVRWLVEQHLEHRNKRWHLRMKWRWDHVIIDESSSFKSHSSERFKALRRVRKYIRRMVQLTGTPSPNGLMDVWAPIFLLDRGQRLGQTITAFRQRWFEPPGYESFRYEMRPGAEREIHERLKDLVISMVAEDYLDLPPVLNNYIRVDMSPAEASHYRKLERDAVLEFAGKRITAVNAGVLWGKLLQMANGAVYYDDKCSWVRLHDRKLDALEELLEVIPGPALVVYSFVSDLHRIKERLDKLKANYRVLKTEQDENDWNDGKIDLLLLHPDSGGHGLNLHKSGAETIIHFGLNPGLERYEQVNARLAGGLRREGRNVVIHHIVTEDTKDQTVLELLEAKTQTQSALMAATSALLKKYKCL